MVDPSVRAHVRALDGYLGRSAYLAGAGLLGLLLQAWSLGHWLPALLERRAHAVVPLAFALIAAASVRAWAAARQERLGAATMGAVRAQVRDAVLDHHEAADRRARDSFGAGRMSTLLTTGLDELEPYVRTYMPATVAATIVPAAVIVVIGVLDLTSAVILLLVVPLVPLFMWLIGTYTADRTARHWAALQTLGARFVDLLAGLPTMRLFGCVDDQIAATERTADRYRAATIRALRLGLLSALVLDLLGTVSVALVAVAIGLRLAGGHVELAPLSPCSSSRPRRSSRCGGSARRTMRRNPVPTLSPRSVVPSRRPPPSRAS